MEAPFYIKDMIQRDLDEKENIKSLIKRVARLQIIISILGFFLVCSFGLNVYFTNLAIKEVLENREVTLTIRQETIKNRQEINKGKMLDSLIIRKIDSSREIK